MEIESRLRVILAEEDISQRNMARDIHISESTLSLLVRGKSLPTLEVAYKVAAYVKKPVEEIWVRK